MERGTYAAASGGLRQIRSLDITTNNLANVNTTGYKRQLLVSSSQRFEDTFAALIEKQDPYARPDHVRSPGAVDLRTMTDFSSGPVRDTGNPLDVALVDPKTFFVVQGKGGEQLYTRAGSFTLDDQGTLVTPEGLPVVGDGGPISATGSRIAISGSGAVLADGLSVGQLQVVKIENPTELERVDGARFRAISPQAQPVAVDSPEILPGSLEMSNVSTIDGVIDLVAAHRGFEMYTKIASTIDELNQTAITRVGKR